LLVNNVAYVMADGHQTIRLRADVTDASGIGLKTTDVTMTDRAGKSYSFKTNDFGRTAFLKVGPRSAAYDETITARSDVDSNVNNQYQIRFINGNLAVSSSAQYIDAGGYVDIIATFTDGSSGIGNVPVTLSIAYANGTTVNDVLTATTDGSGQAVFSAVKIADKNSKRSANIFTVKISKLGLSKSIAVTGKNTLTICHYEFTIPEGTKAPADGKHSFTIITRAEDANGNPISNALINFTDNHGRTIVPAATNSKGYTNINTGTSRFPGLLSYTVSNASIDWYSPEQVGNYFLPGYTEVEFMAGTPVEPMILKASPDIKIGRAHV
jgi:hypothetical protein